MPIRRSDIEKVLDDLISNESGMSFQGLGVILAKQRWPELVACERKKDLGADAISSDKALACSVTAKIDKIRDDVRKIKANFPDIQTLIFATPVKVTNTMAQEWAQELAEKFSLGFIIMPREDIITSLMMPSNTPLCQSYLGLQPEFDASINDLLQKVREATAQTLTGWFPRVSDEPLIALNAVRVNSSGRDTSELLHLGTIQGELIKGRRLILEAPAGRGKTTTLLQVAKQQENSGHLTFWVDLPVWTATSKDVLTFIEEMPAYRSRGLTAKVLSKLHTEVQFCFLLNGWNEIPEYDSTKALLRLRELDSSFPSAGILIASRIHHTAPISNDALRLRLLPVDRGQRALYLSRRLGNRSIELSSILENDVVLDDLTSTPLILSQVTRLFAANRPIPNTKFGVLGAAVELHESSGNHSSFLALPPIHGRSSLYLASIARSMVQKGTVSIGEEDARMLVHSEAKKLSPTPEQDTAAIVNALCAHHLLERLPYPPQTLRFEHQQFQEFYAAVSLKKELLALISHDDRGIARFTKEFVNDPAWTEPLRMIAEGIAANDRDDELETVSKAGTLLIEMASRCDLVFAARLARLCGPEVWKRVQHSLSTKLRISYANSDSQRRELALAAMIATGMDDFKDILVPILSGDDQQERLKTYRLSDAVSLTNLGPTWEKILGTWNDDARSELISELIHGRTSVKPLSAFGLADPSMKVRLATIEGLSWIYSKEDLGLVLQSLDALTFEAAMEMLPIDDISGSLIPRAIAHREKQYEAATDPQTRLNLLLRLAQLGQPQAIGELKAHLTTAVPSRSKLNDHFLKSALDIIGIDDPGWVNDWIGAGIGNGFLWPNHWIASVKSVSSELKQQLIHRLENEDLSQTRFSGELSILSKFSDNELAERCFAGLCKMAGAYSTEGVGRGAHSPQERQIEVLLRALPPDIAVSGALSIISQTVNVTELLVLTRFMASVARDTSEVKGKLSEGLRKPVRDYLLKGLPVILARDDYSGVEKANFLSTLAEVGMPEDIDCFREVILADAERMKTGLAAKLKGEKGAQANGGTTGWSMWNIRSLLALAPEHADTLLMDLLSEPAYEVEAVSALVGLAAGAAQEMRFAQKRNYDQLWEMRLSGNSIMRDEVRRSRYASTIRNRIVDIIEGANSGRLINDVRLKQMATALARLDSRGSKDVILQALSLPGRFNAGRIVEGLTTLTFNGVELPHDIMLRLFDTILGQIRPHIFSEENMGILVDALSLFPFTTDSTAGIEKIDAVLADFRIFSHRLNPLVTALGLNLPLGLRQTVKRLFTVR